MGSVAAHGVKKQFGVDYGVPGTRGGRTVGVAGEGGTGGSAAAPFPA